MCRNSNLKIQRKEVTKKGLEKLVFLSFFGFWQEKPVFLPGSFWQGCQNYFLRNQRNNYRATFLKGSLGSLRIFGYFSKLSGEWRKTFFRVGKTAIDAGGTVYGKTVFKREKIAVFSDFERLFTFSQKFGRIAKPAIYVSVEVFVEKHFLKSFYIFSNFSHFFGVWSNKPLVGKFLSGLSQLQSALLEAFLGISKFFFKKVIIVHLYWSLSISFVF